MTAGPTAAATAVVRAAPWVAWRVELWADEKAACSVVPTVDRWAARTADWMAESRADRTVE